MNMEQLEQYVLCPEDIQRSQTKDNHGNWADLYFYGLLEEDWRKMK